MLGIGDPCDCVCTFPESEIRKFASCAFWNSDRSVHEQWEVCTNPNAEPKTIKLTQPKTIKRTQPKTIKRTQPKTIK